MKYYDNTRVAAGKTCLRKYYFRHVRHWVGTGTAMPLVFGLCWHEAMNVVWGLAKTDKSDKEIVDLAMNAFLAKWDEEGLPTWPHEWTPDDEEQYSPRTPGIAKSMLYGYLKERRQFIQSCEILAIELPFAVPLNAGEHAGEHSDTYYVGRLDKVVKYQGDVIIIEHKSTTSYAKKSIFRTDYLESWSPNSQIDGYIHAANLTFPEERIRGVFVDAALVHKTVHHGFKFIPVSRQMAALDAWLSETNWWIDTIENEKNKLLVTKQGEQQADFQRSFPKNTESCNHWQGCPYRDVCKFMPNPEKVDEVPMGYKVEKWEPFDTLEMEKIGFPPEDSEEI